MNNNAWEYTSLKVYNDVINLEKANLLGEDNWELFLISGEHVYFKRPYRLDKFYSSFETEKKKYYD
jgi:hypothetical protein